VERLMLAEGNRILFSSNNYAFKKLEQKAMPGSKVPLPQSFKVEAIYGDSKLVGDIRINRVQESVDILKFYPLFFRKLAENIVSQTWLYRSWCDFKFDFTQDGKTRTIQGTGTGQYVSTVRASQQK
jgi:hypothetical protein